MKPAYSLILIFIVSCNVKEKNEGIPQDKADDIYSELYRPQFHFSPEANWMNDPNGLVYHEGVYHLFYQYYPKETVWGPMHWGHAVSEDMVHWQHKPIALFPDGNGMIFSGSAVVDKSNTSGFSKNGKTPLVAIFTYHLMEGEKSGRADFQTQGIAYSLDNGNTWTKYDGNPVLGNDGIRDLRDPKVFWHEDTKSWVMALVAGDYVKFYRSKNLKQWDNISDFGLEQGSHGGVWECPDLFPLKVNGTGEEKWVLIVSIGNGGPNGGSSTQYFIGDFDGTNFTSDQTEYKWLDWGPDNYAGVTYNNVPDENRIFIGWMSNWQYAVLTPTEPWRSAMTLPRELLLKKYGDDLLLTNYPIESVFGLVENESTAETFQLESGEGKKMDFDGLNQSLVSFKTTNKDFEMTFSNNLDERFTIIFDSVSKLVMVNRTRSGKKDFEKEFGNKLHYMDVSLLPEDEIEVDIFLDKSSVELFLNKGQYVMTEQIFPTEEYNQLSISNTMETPVEIKNLSFQTIKSIWKND